MAKVKLPDKLSGVKFTTPKARLSFPHLGEATKYDKNSKPAFSAAFLFPKDQDLASMKKSIIEAAKEAFGPDKKKWPKNLSLPWRDGDDKEDLAGYEGHYYVGAKTYNKPVCIRRDKTRIETKEEIEEILYGGCYARAVLVAKATEAGGKFYISLYLQAVQFVADGERFGGGVNVDEDFDDLEDEDFDEEEIEEEESEDEDDDMGF